MEVFGEATEPKGERPLIVKWPLHAANSIEVTLAGLMAEAAASRECDCPMIFIEDGEFANAQEWAALYGPLSLKEAQTIRDIVLGGVAARFRRQLIIARELGERATIELYLIACEAEHVDPLVTRSLP